VIFFHGIGSCMNSRIQIFHIVEVYTNVMLNGNGWATSSEIAAALLLLDLHINVWLHQRNVYSKHTFIPCNTYH
jgi:hypothetical protein